MKNTLLKSIDVEMSFNLYKNILKDRKTNLTSDNKTNSKS
jgi:hypothetical protein